jgi:transcriptional regulator with XRE-family HTH domain
MNYELPKMLRAAREATGLSFTELDRETRISRAYLCQLETGKVARPSFEIVFKLARFFKIAPEVLYYGNSIPKKGRKQKPNL